MNTNYVEFDMQFNCTMDSSKSRITPLKIRIFFFAAASSKA